MSNVNNLGNLDLITDSISFEDNRYTKYAFKINV